MSYTLIGSLHSRALRVAWALEELGLAYEHDACGPHSERAVAHNPSGKIPALVVEGAVLTDSVAIVTFLADRHDRLTHRAGTVARGVQDGLTQLVVDELEGPLWTAAKHRFVLPEPLRVPAIKETARAEFARGLQALEARMGEGPYLTGEDFTVPDILAGHCIGWSRAAGFPWPEEGALAAYASRVRTRPALVRLLAARDAA